VHSLGMSSSSDPNSDNESRKAFEAEKHGARVAQASLEIEASSRSLEFESPSILPCKRGQSEKDGEDCKGEAPSGGSKATARSDKSSSSNLPLVSVVSSA